jgi:hypothetical protein
MIEPEGGSAEIPVTGDMAITGDMAAKQAFDVLHSERCSYRDLLAAIAVAVKLLEDEDKLLIQKIGKDELAEFQTTIRHRVRRGRPKPKRLFAKDTKR